MPQYGLPVQPALNPSNKLASQRVDAQSATIVASRHGRNFEATLAAALGFGCIPLTVPVTTSVALATTYVGLCLSNPAGSGKNLNLLNVSAAFVVAPSTITTLGLAIGYSAAGVVTHTTPITPLQSFINSSTALVAKLDSACTLVGTPVAVKVLGQAPTATTSLAVDRDIDGGIIIPPGGWVATITNIAGPASGFAASMLWEELAI